MVLGRQAFRIVGLVVGFVFLLVGLLALPAWAQTLSVTKTSSPGPVEEGEVITYRIEVSSSDGTSSGVRLTDEVPSGSEFVSVRDNVGDGDSCNEPNDQNIIVCNLGRIESNEAAVVTLRVRANGEESTVTNKATATSDEDGEGQSGSATITIDTNATEGQYGDDDDADNGADENDDNNADEDDRDNVVNVPDKDLPETGGLPLLGVAFFVLAGAGLLTAVVRRRY